MKFTISARGKPANLSISQFLSTYFPNVKVSEIDSVFGFVEACTLYGGRPFREPEIQPADVSELYELGIGLRIPLTNHHASQAEYEQYRPFLSKHHRPGNAIIITNDDLAEWIRRDFPLFRLEASVIKNLNTAEKVREAMTTYDTVIPPMSMNLDHAALAALPNKDRITLFANAGCALTCPSKICYPSFSKVNKFKGGDILCSQPMKARDYGGMIDFDIGELAGLGFSRFKLLRENARGVLRTGY